GGQIPLTHENPLAILREPAGRSPHGRGNDGVGPDRHRGEPGSRHGGSGSMIPSRETQEKIDAAVREYPHARSALLAVLHLIQSERGYIAPEDQAWAATRMGLPPAEVAGDVPFFTLFRNQPPRRPPPQVSPAPPLH